MRKILIVTMSVALALLLNACDSSEQASQPKEDEPLVKQSQFIDDAKAALKQYIDASIHRDYRAVYSMLSSQDKSRKSLADYMQQQEQEANPLADSFYDKIQYEILSLNKNGDNVKAVVEYRFPDLEKMIKDTFNLQVLKPDISNMELQKMKQELEARYNDSNMPVRTNDRLFTLVKEGNNWKLSLNWK